MSSYPAIVRYMERMFSITSVAATCDLHLSILGYFQHMGRLIPLPECDRIYAEVMFPWMPSRLELEAKRVAQGLSALCAEVRSMRQLTLAPETTLSSCSSSYGSRCSSLAGVELHDVYVRLGDVDGRIGSPLGVTVVSGTCAE